MIARILALAALFLFVAPALRAQEAPVDMMAVAADLAAKGDALVQAYDPQDGAATGDGFSDLYFEVFEASGMEQAVGMKSAGDKTRLESKFAAVIGKAGQNSPKAEIEAAWIELKSDLHAVAQAHSQSDSGPVAAFLQSLLILVREGFEAMLVVTALVAYLRRSGQGDKVGVVWQGAAWAGAASLAAAWALHSVLEISGQGQETLEGAVMLAASVLLFYVSFWLLSKRETQQWQAYVKTQVDNAAKGGNLFALGLAAFLAVFREGAETVLFYQALAASQPGQWPAILAGIAAAIVALAGLYAAMRFLSFRLPMGLFFTATAGLLFFLSVTFAGKGVLELQEGRLLPATPLDWLPRAEWLGLFPTVESVAAQAVLLVPMIAGLAWMMLKRRKAEPS